MRPTGNFAGRRCALQASAARALPAREQLGRALSGPIGLFTSTTKRRHISQQSRSETVSVFRSSFRSIARVKGAQGLQRSLKFLRRGAECGRLLQAALRIDLDQTRGKKSLVFTARERTGRPLKLAGAIFRFRALGGVASPSPNPPCHSAQFEGTPKHSFFGVLIFLHHSGGCVRWVPLRTRSPARRTRSHPWRRLHEAVPLSSMRPTAASSKTARGSTLCEIGLRP